MTNTSAYRDRGHLDHLEAGWAGSLKETAAGGVDAFATLVEEMEAKEARWLGTTPDVVARGGAELTAARAAHREALHKDPDYRQATADHHAAGVEWAQERNRQEDDWVSSGADTSHQAWLDDMGHVNDDTDADVL